MKHIEPLEEVVDDLVEALRNRHLERLRNGKCSIDVGIVFMNLLVDVERISDICSNVGVSVVARVMPQLMGESHEYIYHLHSGDDQSFNEEYRTAHGTYFDQLAQLDVKRKKEEAEEKAAKEDKQTKAVKSPDKPAKESKSAGKSDKDKKTKTESKGKESSKSKSGKSSKDDKNRSKSKK